MPIYQIALLVVLGFLPSIIWLIFYFREDCHPEPKHMLVMVFLAGIISSLFAFAFQVLLVKCNAIGTIPLLEKICLPAGFLRPASPEFFVWSAFVEEAVKFFAASMIIFNHPDFDEPIDAMIYMIAAGLGFAAAENTLIVFTSITDGLAATINTLILRFIGATLLHALASGLLGYFLAISWFFQHHRKKLIIIGIILATIFHFAFNMFIFVFESQLLALILTTLLLLGIAFLASILFDRLKSRHLAIS